MTRPDPTPLGDDARRRIRDATRPMAERLDMAARLAPFAPHRHRGTRTSWPTLFLEDISEIPFVDGVPGIEEYQHRSRVRAGDGDLFAAVSRPVPGYEDYCRDHLGFGSPTCLVSEPTGSLLAVATASMTGPTFDAIADTARAAGGMIIHPYMSIGPVWTLAAQITDATSVPVEVIGPPPPILWLANDKNLLSETVQRTLGTDWLVETHIETTPDGLAARLRELATRTAKVGLKRTRCASAMGNVVYNSADLLAEPLEATRTRVSDFLTRTEWPTGEDVLAVAWEETDLSPSTQLWLPPDGQGPPIVEGVYEQLLEGEEKCFLGSRPSTLPDPLNAALAQGSLAVGEAFQSMGYVGRCSFDFIVVGDPADHPRVMFTECNGRWGGTSTPMHLVDRLFPNARPHYIAQDFIHPGLVGAALTDVLAQLGDALYNPATGRGRYAVYNVGPLEKKGKLDVVALGESPEEAFAAMRRDLPRLLGLAPA